MIRKIQDFVKREEFKIKIICIKECVSHGITIGKIYETIYLDNWKYIIINDNGTQSEYDKQLFKTIEKHREDRLNEIIK